jgi:hypothetical protein
MENQPSVDHQTVLDHKRQFIWQILVPFLLMAGVIIAGAILVVMAGESRTSTWADVSLIWLLAPMLFFALVILLTIISIVYGMAKLLQVLPKYTGKAQGFFVLLSTGTRNMADGATKPAIWFRQAGAVIKSIFKPW